MSYTEDATPVVDAVQSTGFSVTLAAVPSHAGLSSSGMTMRLPYSPRFPGDAFAVAVSASLIGVAYGLMAWTLTLTSDAAAFQLSSYAHGDHWNAPTASETSGSLQLLVNSPVDSDTANPLVRGDDIPILTSRFVVVGSAASGDHRRQHPVSDPRPRLQTRAHTRLHLAAPPSILTMSAMIAS